MSYNTCKLFFAACLSLLLPLSISLCVAVNILLCDILTQAFFSFEIDLHELFFFCKVLKFAITCSFCVLSSSFCVVCLCVCVHMFSWGPKTSSLQVVHGSKLSSFLWICLSSISFSGICNIRDGYFCIAMIIANRQNFRQTNSRREKTRSKLQKEYCNLLLSFLSVFIFLEY